LDLYQVGAYLLFISKFLGFYLVIKEFDMTTPSTPSTVAVSTSARFGAWISKVFLNRSMAIIWWTGLAALMAAFRLATDGAEEGEEMFRAWMIDWAVIWVALAGLSLRLIKPLYDLFVENQVAQLEAYQINRLRKVLPSFDQELRTMALHQQMRDEEQAEKAAAASEALSGLGAVSGERGADVSKALRLGTRLGSAT
jgi:hypothetical protein